jgi:hypothetical protein
MYNIFTLYTFLLLLPELLAELQSSGAALHACAA